MKNFKVGPLILIALGVIFLLNNFGILPWSIWNNLWKFWPALLVLIGIEFLVGQKLSLKTFIFLAVLVFLIPVFFAINPFSNNPLATSELKIDQEIGSLSKAKLIVDLPASNINLKAEASGSARLSKGSIFYSKASNKPDFIMETAFNQGLMTIRQKGEIGLSFITALRNNLDLSLTKLIPLEILIRTTASQANLNLKELKVDYLEVDTKASNISISFAPRYSQRAIIKTNASTIEIQIPAEIAARIKIDSTVKSLNVGDRYRNKNGIYQTDDYDMAFEKVDLEIKADAGSITIK